MATVDVLVTGYVEQTDAGDSSVHPTVSLVRDGVTTLREINKVTFVE